MTKPSSKHSFEQKATSGQLCAVSVNLLAGSVVIQQTLPGVIRILCEDHDFTLTVG